MNWKKIFKILPKTFKIRLITYSLILSTVPILLLGLISATISSNGVQEEVELKNKLVLNQIEFQLTNFLKQLSYVSVEIASDSRITSSTHSGFAGGKMIEKLGVISALDHYQNFSPIKFSISLIYPENDYVYSKQGSSTYRNSIFYHIIKNREQLGTVPFYYAPDQRLNQNELLLFRTVPLGSGYSKNSILVLHVNIEELIDELGLPKDTEESEFYLIDDTGHIFVSKNLEEIGKPMFTQTELNQFWSEPDGYWGDIVQEETEYRVYAKKWMYAEMFYTEDWTFVALFRSDAITSKSNLIRALSWGITGLLLIIWLIVFFFALRRMYTPIENLTFKFRKAQNNENVKGANPKDDPKDDLKELDLIVSQMQNDYIDLLDKVNEHQPYVQESVIRQLLSDEINDKELASLMKEIPFLDHYPRFSVGIIQVDRQSEFIRKYRLRDRRLIQYAMCKLIQELFEPITQCLTMVQHPTRIVVVVGWSSEDNDSIKSNLEKVADQYREFVIKYYKFTTSVSISNVRVGIEGIYSSYQKVVELLEHRVLLGDDVTISEDSISTPNQLSKQTMSQHQKNILEAVLSYDHENALKHFDLLVVEVKQSFSSSARVFGFFSYFVGKLDEMLLEVGMSLQECLSYDAHVHLYSLGTLEDIHDWMKNTLIPVTISSLQQIKGGDQLMKQAELYVQMHYDQDISLQQLADMYHLTPSKLSRMFKDSTGLGFGEYVASYRMEKAKEWLREDEMKIREISERLRYSAVQSFNRAFRQMTGLSPSEYRKQFRN